MRMSWIWLYVGDRLKSGRRAVSEQAQSNAVFAAEINNSNKL